MDAKSATARWMIVCDASVLVDALRGVGPAVDRIDGEALHAPHLLDVEVAHAFRRMSADGKIDADVAAGLLAIDARFTITRYAHTGLLLRAWELRHNLTTYDGMYFALAEVLDIPLVTLEARLAGVPGTRCIVEVLPSAP